MSSTIKKKYLLLFSCLLLVTANLFAAESYNLYIDTREGGEISERRINLLKQYLQQNQCNITNVITDNNSAAKPSNGLIFSPLHMPPTEAATQLASIAIINGEPLAASILVKSATGIKDIKNLQGVRISFLSKQSVTGYQLQQELLVQAGVIHSEDKITYTGTHSAAASLLLHGDVFAAAIATPLAKAWAKANNLILVITSKPIQAGGLWATKNMPKDDSENCIKAFTKLTKTNLQEKKLLSLFPAWLDSFHRL